MKFLTEISKKITEGKRISEDEAAFLFLDASDDVLQKLATACRNRFHDEKKATYLKMAIINYTNVCIAACDYCAFYRLPHAKDTYLLTQEEIFQKIDQLLNLGGTLVGFNGGFHPKLKLQDYANIFKSVREKYGDQIEFYGMTVAEFMFACKISKISYQDGAKLLLDNGSRWVTGGGAEILDNQFRKRHSPGKYTVEDYYLAQRAIIESGLGSTATMVIGFDETLDERLSHLKQLREFQDSIKGAMPSFLCWTYKPFHTKLGGKEISTQEYLRWLAVCRIYLDNFKHIRTSVLTKNEEALLGLRYGADDFDLPTEDEVTQKAGATIEQDFERVLNAARGLGFLIEERESFSNAKD